jgi:hypothetical protein
VFSSSDKMRRILIRVPAWRWPAVSAYLSSSPALRAIHFTAPVPISYCILKKPCYEVFCQLSVFINCQLPALTVTVHIDVELSISRFLRNREPFNGERASF